MGRWETFAVMLILCIGMVSAEKTIFRQGEDIVMQIEQKTPKLLKQTGFERNFYYNFSQINETHWEITICHKNFAQNKNHILPSGNNLNDYPSETKHKKTKVKKKDHPKLKLKNKQCDTLIVQMLPSDLLKLGEESTEIIISDDNVTLVVHPEEKECEGLECESEIILNNLGTDNITINSDDIWVSIEQESTHKIYTKKKVLQYIYDCPQTAPCTPTNQTQWGYDLMQDASQGFEVVLEPNQTQIFYLKATMLQKGFFKYNVSIDYNNETFEVDPYFDVLDPTLKTKFFEPALDQGYNVNAKVNILGGVYTNSTVDTVIFRIQYPNTTIIDLSPEQTQQFLYHSIADDPEGTNVTGALFYSFGDTSWGGNRFWNTVFLIRGHPDGYIDGISQNNDLIFGDPQAKGFIYDLWICEASTVNQTSSFDIFEDCADTPTLVADNINVSKYWDNTISSVTGFKYLNFDEPYYLDSSKNYLYIQDYVSSVNDLNNASDVWLIRLDAVGQVATAKPYRYLVEEQNGSIGNNYSFGYITDFKLRNDYAWNYTFTDTAQEGTYIVTLIANDTLGNSTSSTFTQFNICTPNFVCNSYGSCNTSDLQVCNGAIDSSCGQTYTGNFSEFAPQSCNYCSEDIQEIRDTCVRVNGTAYYQNVSYQDNNYFSCCILTNLPSDCSILFSPYNVTTLESCNLSLPQDFLLDLDIEITFGFGVGGLNSDKVHGKIWINDTNTSYYCLSYVKTLTGELVQTNPPYTQRVGGGILQLTTKEIEDREFFITQNGLANVYWTDDELVIDGRQYIFGVECSGNNQLLVSEVLGQTEYDPVNAPITRGVWITQNMFGITIFVVIILMIGLAIFFVWRFVKR